jgi:hypothetical protein
MESSVLRLNKLKNVSKDFKFQTFTTKKFENLKHDLFESEHRLISFTHTDEYRKSFNEKCSITNKKILNYSDKTEDDDAIEEDESDYEEKQNLSILSNSSFQPIFISKCIVNDFNICEQTNKEF